LNLQLKHLIIVAYITFLFSSFLVSPIIAGSQKTLQTSVEKDFWLETAGTAWRYFKPGVGVSISTGLNYGSLNWHRLTDWDLGIYISALIAARNLGILGEEGEWGFNGRIGKVLKFLSERPISPNGIPYWSYDSDSGGSPSEELASPSDFGRLLLALDDLRKVNPEWASQINFIISRYNVSALANSKYFAGNGVYEYYSARGYWAFDFDTPALKALENLGNGKFMNLYGINLPKAWITSEPLVLAVLEGKADKQYKSILDKVFEAQKRRYENEGVLTAFSEGAYFDPYYYIYEWIITGDGKTWVLWVNNKAVNASEAIFTKVAYGFYAIYGDEYSKRLVDKVKNLVTEEGFLEGVTVNGEILNIVTDKTNSMILEAAAYAYLKPLKTMETTLPINETEKKVFEAFKAVAEAEEKGGNISILVAELNSAIKLIQEAEATGDKAFIEKALVKLDKIISEAPKVGESGLTAARWRQIKTMVALSIEVAVGLIVYIYAPKAFWRAWIKVKGKWKVKTVEKR